MREVHLDHGRHRLMRIACHGFSPGEREDLSAEIKQWLPAASFIGDVEGGLPIPPDLVLVNLSNPPDNARTATYAPQIGIAGPHGLKHVAKAFAAFGWSPTPSDEENTLSVADRPLTSQAGLGALLIDAAPVVVVSLDSQGLVRSVNRYFEELTGFRSDEAVGRDWFQEFVPARERDHVRSVFANAMSGKATRGNVNAILTRDGGERLIEWNDVELPGPDGTRAGLVAIGIDVTERVTSERRRSELADLVDASRNEIYVFRPGDLRFISGNRGAIDNLGYSMNELLQMTPLDIKPEFTPDSFRSMVQPLVDGAVPQLTFETTHRRKDGSEYPVEVRLQLMKRGAEPAFVAMILDITDRRKAEKELAASERRLRSIIDGMFAYTTLYAPDGVAIEVNRYQLEQWGLPREDFIGKRPWETVRWAGSPAAREALRQAYARVARGETIRQELTTTLTDGRRVTTDSILQPLYGDTGDVVALLSFAVDVTERVRAVEALQASEARLSEAQQLAKLGSFELDSPGATITGTPEFFRIFEIPAEAGRTTLEEVLGRVHPDERAETRRHYEESFKSTAPAETKNRLVMPDGQVKHVTVRIQSFRNAQGSVLRIVGTVQDVTAQHQTEQALRESEARFRQVFHSLPIPAAIISASGVLKDVNQAYLDAIGYQRDELIGRTMLEIGGWVNSDDRETFLATLRSTGTVMNFETSILHKDGRPLAALLSGSLVSIEGEPNILVSAVDVTDRLRAVAALRESEARLQEAQRIAQLGSWDLDLVTGHLQWSDEIFTIFGIDPERFGASYEAFLATIHPEDRDAVDLAYRTSVDAHEPYEIAHRLLLPDGTVKYVRERGETYYNAAGTPLRSVGTVQDVTEIVRAEADRAALETQLRHAQKMEAIGTLAGGIAHDFNNILAAIIGNSELAELANDSGPATREAIDEIRKASLRAKELIKQILAFSRKQEQPKTPVAIGPIVDEAVSLLRASIPSTVEIRLERPVEVPRVFADPTQVHQVLVNLGTNAWQALEGRPGVVVIRESVATLNSAEASSLGLTEGRYVCLTVSDNGPGIAPSALERLFEPFYTTKAPGAGTGLGLAVVHGIVTSHGGAIRVTSEPGRGASFDVLLPVASVEPSAFEEPSSELHSVGSRHILCVDDEPALVLLSKRTLEKMGYQVTATTSPDEALLLLAEGQQRFDAVITDMNMPTASGLDVLRHVRARFPDLPVLITSGLLEDDVIAAATAMGKSYVLSKPATRSELAAVLSLMLSEPGNPA